MKVVIQRVSEASVRVEGNVVGSIGSGLVVLLGVHQHDVPEKTQWFVNKLLNLRIFEDEAGKMNLSVKDVKGEVLVVSQFTLYANCMRGRRPDFLDAALSDVAEPIYDKFVSEVNQELGSVQAGIFGASMKVALVNDGPVTIVLEENGS